MNRIKSLFISGDHKIFSVYFTAGFPALNDTLRVIRELDKAGVDLIEIGIPFSDPVADGPVIQNSSEKALYNGMNLNLLFDKLAKVREVTEMPLIMMGYLNPVLKFGVEAFLEKCRSTGIDGTIIPDLPLEEYQESYRKLFRKYGIINIFLISPQTTTQRILDLDAASEGFLYIVSTSSTTGPVTKFNDESISYFKRIRDMKLKSPGLIGFGISNNETYRQACTYADGAIIGSAFVKALNEKNKLEVNVGRFLTEFKNGNEVMK